MSHVPHELGDEFPDAGEILHDLKLSNTHFQRISDKYHEVNREIHRIEAETEAASDSRLEDLKKQRLGILDEVAGLIAQHKAPT